MAENKPAAEPAVPSTESERVRVYDTPSGTKLPNSVPRSWLDGRFPNLKEQPSSKKAGK